MDVEIEVLDRKRTIKNVPETNWEELKPYWSLIAKSIIEVFLEGNFKPYSVRKERKDGFYASLWYWEQSERNSKEYPLGEAKRFLKMLLKKKDFVKSIREFNKPKGVNWILKKNIRKLRQFLYSKFFYLERLLESLKKK